MDANNPKQSVNPPETPVQNPIPERPVKNQRGTLPIILGVLVLLLVVGGGAYYWGSQNSKQPAQLPQNVNNTPIPTTSSETKESPTPSVDTKNGVTVKVVNGDILVTQNGKDMKITTWGYNSDPVLSPDGSKIAYISKSKESIENEKVDQGYKRTSTNVWVVNSNGSNPIQVTNHINFVYRSHPHWLDNNRLLFVEGEQSVKVYNTSTKALQAVMGPEKAVQTCLDACGYEIRYFYSPNYSYLIRLSGGVAFIKNAILNTKSLMSTEIDLGLGQEYGLDFETVTFPENGTLTFNASKSPDYDKQITVSINLSTAQVNKR